MNKKGQLLAVICGMCGLMSSCLGSDTVEESRECAITAFSVGDIKSTIHLTGYDGSDSTVTRTLSGSEVLFSIDQIGNRIFSVDSLASWVQLTRVVPTVTYTGSLYYKVAGDSIYYPLTSGSDSVDFSSPVMMAVISTDGEYYREYTVSMPKCSANADSLVWTSLDGWDGVRRPVKYFDTEAGAVIIEDDSAGVRDFSSVTSFGDYICWLNPSHDSLAVLDTRTSDVTMVAANLDMLLGSDAYFLYAAKGREILSSTDFLTWTANGVDSEEMLPLGDVSCMYYDTKTNAQLQNVVMIGVTDKNADNTVVWHKISSSSPQNNQEWNYINITANNPYFLPKADYVTAAYYDGAVYALVNGKFYRSYDNGISWREMTEDFMVPEGFCSDLPAYLTVGKSAGMNGRLILVQGGDATRPGHCWVGTLNRLNK